MFQLSTTKLNQKKSNQSGQKTIITNQNHHFEPLDPHLDREVRNPSRHAALLN